MCFLRLGPSTRFKVLIVDDYEPFRRVARLILQARDDLQIVGEAADGLEAVQQALQLRPDVIVLDLDLPRLNGIQVAKRIGGLVPEAKIIFVGVESSMDVVEETLKVGAGHIHKILMSYELLPAIDVVLSGRQFVSEEIRPSALSGAHSEHDARRHKHPQLRQTGAHHEVFFYPTEALLVAGFARYIEANTRSENVVISVVTELHRAQIREVLGGRGLDMKEAVRNGRYISLDSMDTLSLFMVDGWPDASLFRQAVEGLIRTAVESSRGRHRRVAVCGQLAPILWVQGKRNAAIEIEQLWDEMCSIHGVDTLCGYVSATADRDRHPQQFNLICGAHSAVHFR